MIHRSQLKIETAYPVKPGGQHVGLRGPGVVAEHLPSGCSITVKGGRSQHECKRIAEEALEYALLEMRWHAVDLARDITEPTTPQ